MTLRAILPVLAFGRNQTTATYSSHDSMYSPRHKPVNPPPSPIVIRFCHLAGMGDTSAALVKLTHLMYPDARVATHSVMLVQTPKHGDPDSWHPMLQLSPLIPPGYHFHSHLRCFEDASFQGTFAAAPAMLVPPTWHLAPFGHHGSTTFSSPLLQVRLL